MFDSTTVFWIGVGLTSFFLATLDYILSVKKKASEDSRKEQQVRISLIPHAQRGL